MISISIKHDVDSWMGLSHGGNLSSVKIEKVHFLSPINLLKEKQ
jgi:hypothetical protein